MKELETNPGAGAGEKTDWLRNSACLYIFYVFEKLFLWEPEVPLYPTPTFDSNKMSLIRYMSHFGRVNKHQILMPTIVKR